MITMFKKLFKAILFWRKAAPQPQIAKSLEVTETPLVLRPPMQMLTDVIRRRGAGGAE